MSLEGAPPPPPPPPPFTANIPPPPPPPAPVIPPGYVSAAEVQAAIEAARQEEKDKLYPRIETMSTELRTLTQAREEQLARDEAEQQRLAEAARLAHEAEMTASQKFEEYKSSSELRFAQIEEQRALDAAIHAKEMQLSQLTSYKIQRLSDEEEYIIPELRDFVRGSSNEEIDASIEMVKERTAAIVAGMREATGANEPRRPAAIPVTGTPPIDSGAGNAPLDRKITSKEIAELDIEDYSNPEVRAAILRSGSEFVRQHGIYAPAE